MERSHSPTGHDEPPAEGGTKAPRDVDGVVVLEDWLKDDDWPIIQRLWRDGVSNDGIYHLLRLRLAYQRKGLPEMDGFASDARFRFARWLVETGRLSEGR